MWRRVFSLAVALLISVMAVAQDSTTKPKSFVVELVDVDGRPVEGAHVGIMGAVGENIAGQVTEWYYCSPAGSDASGSARVTEDNEGMLDAPLSHSAPRRA